ncbi:MAG TPA: 4'-phosphopantetheinyl transferase superfamily protein [Candidatus Dormibacteraeota bacterium]|nr:4'-phosphopantetheinyl transferase superfamily protein [Candidatus Dormibacteraeota bacterium]
MIASLLPAGVITIEAGDADWTAPLLPEEEPLVARAVEKRRREFAAGRSCARRALAELGWPDYPLLSGPKREPVWPPGIVGAITHCPGYCAAAVARAADVRSLGIDAEVRGPLPDGVGNLVCTPAELHLTAGLPGDHWGTLVFSAKESIYKAWYPIAQRWLDYRDAELSIDADGGRFRARILLEVEPGVFPWNPLDGRFAIGDQRVYTAVTVPA